MRAVLIKNGSHSDVEPGERDGSEVDGPDIVVDFFETDAVSTEQVRDVDPDRAPSDSSMWPAGPELARSQSFVEHCGVKTEK